MSVDDDLEFDSFFRRNLKVLLKCSFYASRGREHEDILQEAACRIYKNYWSEGVRLVDQSDTNRLKYFRTTIISEVRNTAKRKWEKEPLFTDIDINQPNRDKRFEPEFFVEWNHAMRLLLGLSMEERMAIVWQDEGLTSKEIAAHLNCPVGTVKSLVSRAKKKLRDRRREDEEW